METEILSIVRKYVKKGFGCTNQDIVYEMSEYHYTDVQKCIGRMVEGGQLEQYRRFAFVYYQVK